MKTTPKLHLALLASSLMMHSAYSMDGEEAKNIQEIPDSRESNLAHSDPGANQTDCLPLDKLKKSASDPELITSTSNNNNNNDNDDVSQWIPKSTTFLGSTYLGYAYDVSANALYKAKRAVKTHVTPQELLKKTPGNIALFELYQSEMTTIQESPIDATKKLEEFNALSSYRIDEHSLKKILLLIPKEERGDASILNMFPCPSSVNLHKKVLRRMEAGKNFGETIQTYSVEMAKELKGDALIIYTQASNAYEKSLNVQKLIIQQQIDETKSQWRDTVAQINAFKFNSESNTEESSEEETGEEESYHSSYDSEE